MNFIITEIHSLKNCKKFHWFSRKTTVIFVLFAIKINSKYLVHNFQKSTETHAQAERLLCVKIRSFTCVGLSELYVATIRRITQSNEKPHTLIISSAEYHADSLRFAITLSNVVVLVCNIIRQRLLRLTCGGNNNYKTPSLHWFSHKLCAAQVIGIWNKQQKKKIWVCQRWM